MNYPKTVSTLRTGLILGTLSLPIFFSAACENEATKGKPQATATEAQPQKEVDTKGIVFQIDSAQSSFQFVGAKLSGTHEGAFEKLKGNITVSPNAIKEGKVEVEIDVNSLKIEPEKLAGHLKSPDFFDVEKFPTAKFVSTKIESGDKADSFKVTGNLSLHGVTKSISFPTTAHVTEGAAHFQAEFAINRKDFDVVYPGMPDDLIKDDVLIKLNLQAKP